MASSRTARRKRRQAAALRRYKRLRHEGRLPVHTRAERKRDAEERERQREADRRRTRRNRKFAVVAGTPTAAAAIIIFAPPVHISLHDIYGPYAAAELNFIARDQPDYPRAGTSGSGGARSVHPGSWHGLALRQLQALPERRGDSSSGRLGTIPVAHARRLTRWPAQVLQLVPSYREDTLGPYFQPGRGQDHGSRDDEELRAECRRCSAQVTLAPADSA